MPRGPCGRRVPHHSPPHPHRSVVPNPPSPGFVKCPVHSFIHSASTQLLSVYYDPVAGYGLHVYPRLSWVPIMVWTHSCGCRRVCLHQALCGNCVPVLQVCNLSPHLFLWLTASACPCNAVCNQNRVSQWGYSQGDGTASFLPQPLHHVLSTDTRGRCGLAVTLARDSRSRQDNQ